MSLRTKLYFIKVLIALAYCLPVTLMSHLVPSFAATGDLLYSNCAGSGCTGADSNVGYLTRTVESSGCVSGSCLKLVAGLKADGSKYGGSSGLPIGAPGVSGKKEITVVYYTKFSKAKIDAGNIKAIRPYTGGSAYYFGTNITQHWGQDLYTSKQNGTFRPESSFTIYDNGYNAEYAVANDDGTYDVSQGKMQGTFDYSATGGQDGFGAYWTKVREWIKLPSTTTADDGEIKVWINDQLAYTGYDLSHQITPPQATFSGFTFYPSSEAGEAFEQWMDEMVIYEGYVPPEGSMPSNAPSAPKEFTLKRDA